MRSAINPRPAAARGFSLVEMLVTLAVVGVMMLGLYELLDSSNRLAKQESQAADAQAASRSGIHEVARLVRQARVGQLYFGNSIVPLNNVGTGPVPAYTISDQSGNAHDARTGTDVLEVRGVLFDQIYFFDAKGISGTTALLTVKMTSKSPQGVTNFVSGGKPAFANRTSPFLFVIATSEVMPVTVGAAPHPYDITMYLVGLVDPGSFTSPDADTFTFTMKCDPASAPIVAPYYTSAGVPTIQRPFAGGPLDDVVFYVDKGTADMTGAFTHPYLAQATLDASSTPGSLKYDIQPLADEVEDFQVAYGIDGADGSTHDRGVDPAATSVTQNQDEWVYNVSGDTPLTIAGGSVTDFIDTTNTQDVAIAALRSVLIGIVAKSSEPDSGGGSSASFASATGYKLYDSAATPIDGGAARKYRRRVQTLAVNLRNYL